MTGVGAHTPVIKVGGSPLSAAQLDDLVSMRVELALGLVGRATLRFIDPGYGASSGSTFALGTQVEIEVPGGATKLISGTVTGVSLEQKYDEAPMFAVVVDDAAYRLTRGTHVQTYTKSSYADVVKQICSRNGLTAQIQGTAMATPPHDYLLQAGTDMAFLNSVVRRVGYVWWVEGPRTLKLAPASTKTGPVNLDLGGPEIPGPGAHLLKEFSVRASGLRPSETEVTGWDPAAGQAVVGKNRSSPSPASSKLAAQYDGQAPSKKLSAAPTAVIDPNPKTASEAEQIASALYDEWQAGAVVARGTCDATAAIGPLVEVSVTNAGPSTGKYVVTEVEHTYSRTGFFTSFVAGPRQPSGLVDTLGSPDPDPGFSAHGLVIGTVTDNKDPEKHGRVKVTYLGISGSVVSEWARIVTLGGGAKRGITFPPEVGDEVLVGFERGDTRNPFVFGGLYSKQHAVPINPDSGSDSAAVNYRQLTSRLGHVVELGDGDKPETQHVLLHLADEKHRLRLGKDKFDIAVPANTPLTIAVGKAKIDIDASENITIEGASITLKAKTGAVKIEGQTTEVKASAGAAKVEGVQLDLKGSATAKLEGGGQTTIKGAMVAIN